MKKLQGTTNEKKATVRHRVRKCRCQAKGQNSLKEKIIYKETIIRPAAGLSVAKVEATKLLRTFKVTEEPFCQLRKTVFKKYW